MFSLCMCVCVSVCVCVCALPQAIRHSEARPGLLMQQFFARGKGLPQQTCGKESGRFFSPSLYRRDRERLRPEPGF